MIEQALARLDQLAQTDATLAPLARLQAEALRASADAAWEGGVPALHRQDEPGVPLLHGQTVRADLERVRRLLARLAQVISKQSAPGTDAAVATTRAIESVAFDRGALLQAVIIQDGDALARLASAAGADPPLLAMLGNLAASPLLLACGRRAAPLLAEARWHDGYCPVCAAWPTLAELRGLERTRWLRCGRCGSGWRFTHGACPYCASADSRSSGYLAPEAARDARRAVTCDACKGYLKTVTTIAAIAPIELGMMDAQTVELDVAALEHGYGRPDAMGFPMTITIDLVERRSLWRAWRR